MKQPDWFRKISHCRIEPGLSIARVGNSATDELYSDDDLLLQSTACREYKDVDGRIKKQAARFRIYAYDAQGRVLGVIDNRNARCTWRVHLANQKASFQIDGSLLEQRERILDPGPRELSSTDTTEKHFDTGKKVTFGGQSKKISLGCIRTDESGHLLVVPADGVAGSTSVNNPALAHGKNADWYDDTADGPVTATVELVTDQGMRVFEAERAWVVVAPPDFAPDIKPLVSLYDVVACAGGREFPLTVNYFKDIYPVLKQTLDLAWVCNSAHRGHGAGKPATFDLLGDALSRPVQSSPDAEKNAIKLRRRILSIMRKPQSLNPQGANGADVARVQATARYMPPLPGYAQSPVDGDAASWLSVLPQQYKALECWAEGKFVRGDEPSNDWNGAGGETLDTLSLDSQPEALQRVALSGAVGGGFCPGYEVSVAAEAPATYRAEFRINHGVKPGDLTKELLLPWHASLLHGTVPRWPSQVPVDVTPEASFEQAQKEGARLASAFEHRVKWQRNIGMAPTVWMLSTQDPEVTEDRIAGDSVGDMIRFWSELGVVVARHSEDGQTVFVEAERHSHAGLNTRALYHGLLNADTDIAFRGKAKEYVESVLTVAQSVQAQSRQRPEQFFDCIKPFEYSEQRFETRMKDIYNDACLMATRGTPYDPADDPLGTRDLTEARIKQFAPFNLVDGSWLRNINRVGPMDEVRALLGRIHADEMGNGVPANNHATIYQGLCQSIGYQPGDMRSVNFRDAPDLMTAGFENPAFQLAISEFTEDYYPELIGMTLYLEWTVPSLKPVAEKLRWFGIDTHYFDMHLAIDNAAEGHGRQAVDAVKQYLIQVRQLGGEQGVQDIWKRVWNGFVAFSLVQDRLVDQVRTGLLVQTSTRERLIEVISAKKEFAQFNHHGMMLGGWRIDDLFDYPHILLDKLAESSLVIPKDPLGSPFMRLFDVSRGRMYGVFNAEEIALWGQWISELGISEQQVPQSVKENAQACVIDVAESRNPEQKAPAWVNESSNPPTEPCATELVTSSVSLPVLQSNSRA